MKSQLPTDIVDRIRHCGVVAVLVIDHPDDAVPLARSLLDGGIDVMELTLRTAAAIDAMRAIRAQVPEMLAGVGTILNPGQVHDVAAAGAAFGVAPGTNVRVIQAAQQSGLPFAPGIATPSDLETALEHGCRDVKFFPAEPSGGLKYLRSLAAPYAHLGVNYIPLGGVSEENLSLYLSEPTVMAVGGSWLAPRELIRQHDWSAITARAAAARQIANECRGVV